MAQKVKQLMGTLLSLVCQMSERLPPTRIVPQDLFNHTIVKMLERARLGEANPKSPDRSLPTISEPMFLPVVRSPSDRTPST